MKASYITKARVFSVEMAPMILLCGIALRTVLQSSNVALVDAGVKVIFYGICILIVLGISKVSISRKIAFIVIPMIMYLSLPTIHHLLSDVHSADLIETEKKEILRMLITCVAVILAGVLSTGKIKIKNMAMLLSVAGAVTGIFAVYHSMTGHAENAGRYILSSSLIRAGSETSDSNALSAYLNLCSFMSVYILFTTRGKVKKTVALVMFMLCQAGRVMTLSTGGHVGFIVTALVVLGIYMHVSRDIRKKTKIIISAGLSSLFIIALAISRPEILEIIFSRFDYSNKYIYEASIGSRIEQYSLFIDLASEDALALMVGFGYAKTLESMSLGYEIHNIFLRAISAGGLVGLGIYLVFLANLEAVLRSGWATLKTTSNDWIFHVIVYSAFLGWMVQAMTLPVDVSVLTMVFAVFAAALSRIEVAEDAKVLR